MSYKRLTWLHGVWRIHRIEPCAYRADDRTMSSDGFHAVIRTPDEVTVITGDATDRPVRSDPPAPIDPDESSGPWAVFRVSGAIPHDVTGVLAGISAALAETRIPIFVVSTFDTDYIMVPNALVEDTTSALQRTGYRFDNTP